MYLKKFKPLANILSFIMLLSITFNTGIVQTNAFEQSIAEWEITGKSETRDILATGGANKEGAILTHSNDSEYSFSAGSLALNGWDNGANKKYWQISVSTEGYDNLVLSAKTRSSNSGPTNFKVIYSLDGIKWDDVPKSTYQVKETLSNYMPALSLPKEANDASNLFIRFIMNDNKPIKGSQVTNSGVSNINNIKLTGSPIKNDKNVGGVTADIKSGSAVAVNQEISLNCETKGATIKYSINNSEFKDYDEKNKPKLNELPATLVTYAVKEGLKDSVKTTFTYTKAQVSSVKASPNGGAINIGEKVELKCSTLGATIKYSIDNGATWINYSSPITIETLPAKILAKATYEGMTDSFESQFNYTKRESLTYTQYFGQLHSHTTNSDGLGTLDDAYQYASHVPGLDFLAVTDHSNSFDNDKEATINDGSCSTKWKNGREAADKFTTDKFIGIYGYEMTWSNGIGHMNAFNTEGFQSRQSNIYKTSSALQSYFNALKTAPQGISQFNHPGTTFGDFNDFAHYDPEIDNLVNMVEVGNGEGVIRGTGYFPSYEYYTRALDKGWHVAPTNNQDNHKGKWGDANTARSVVLVDTLSRDNIYDAMRNRRIYATEDKNLKIMYTLNNEVMGTILEESPSKINISVQAEDPDGEALGKIEVIANGGKVVDSKTVNNPKADVQFELPNDYSYYYIRIQQEDLDIAVTAPVWTGEVEKAGIAKVSTTTVLPVKGENVDITTEIYNNEPYDMEVKNIEYSIDGKIIGNETGFGTVDSLTTKKHTLNYISENAGKVNVDVKITALMNGVEKLYSGVLKLKFSDPSIVSKVIIDGTHYNDYVTGWYADNMGNFSAIAAEDGIQVSIEKEKITEEMLKNADLLVLTAPAKKEGAYKPQEYSDDFIKMIKNYVDNGGNIIMCGTADYQDGKGNYQTSTQLNKLLEAIGAKSRINNDEVVDKDINGGQPYRLKFKKFNMDSPFLNGVVPEQEFSYYSGCSIALDEESVKNGETQWLVNGHDTTYSFDSNKNLEGVNLEKGKVCVLASEKLSGGGTMLIGGSIFISNFEVKASMDNYNDLQYTNYNIVKNMLSTIKRKLEISNIADARKGNKGDVFKVEGIVTAGKEEGKAFFDTLYIQDETGGINLFPISDDGIKVGQRVVATGTVDEYLGDLELRVIDAEVIDKSINPIKPEEVSTKDAMDYDKVGGKLLKVNGKVTKVEVENGIISYLMVKDDSNVDAKVFIDGYIGTAEEQADLVKLIKEGSKVSAVGLASYDTDGARLRVRDLGEVFTMKEESKDPVVKPANPSENPKEPEIDKNKEQSSDLNPTDGKNLNDKNNANGVKTGDSIPVILLTTLALSIIVIFALRRKKTIK